MHPIFDLSFRTDPATPPGVRLALGRRGMALVGALAFVWLTACSAKIQPVESPVEPPARFTHEGTQPLEDRWWLAFDDPALDRLVDAALERNFSLLAAWDRLAQADARLGAARAGLYPTLNATASDTHSWRRQDTPAGTQTGHSEQKSLGLAAAYEVDLWGRVRALRNAGALDLAASEHDLVAAAITLSARIASTWYQVREQVGQLAVLDRQIEINETVLGVVESRFRRGLASATDILQQRQLIESRREERHRVQTRIETFEIALAILVGETPGPGVARREAAPADWIELPPLPATGLPADLVARRPDIRSAYMAVQAADQRTAAAIANRYPRLSLTASASTTGEQWRDLFDNWLLSLGANLTAPLLDGGARRAEVRRSEAAALERFHQYGQTMLEALGEVERALVQEQGQFEIVEAIERQLEIAREAHERIRAQYLRGREPYSRILDAQQSLQALERRLLSARRERVEARIDLCRALAGGWDLTPPEERLAAADPDPDPDPDREPDR